MEVSGNQPVLFENPFSVSLDIKREDLLHPFVSGNKYRKLKYNLAAAKVQKQDVLLTFGGAFSNHIAAVAAAGKEYGFETIGVIRGEEIGTKTDANPTLKFALSQGMKLHFVSREAYTQKETPGFLAALQSEFGNFYLLPEGGTNELAVEGCEEILQDTDTIYDYVCCAVGTAGTLAGLSRSAREGQKILGFPALKADLSQEVQRFTTRNNWELISEYHFGGYGKVSPELIGFINEFGRKNKIQLDPVYTGKLLYGITDLAQKGYFPKGSKILAIHTGGLQGIAGMNQRLKNKNIQIISTHD